ncbi:MAG TPA: hypothetical protein VLH84_04500 [Patescibacteria group bacterium]|nr:hypothetical protein [Patescibacteria group bacterium]
MRIIQDVATYGKGAGAVHIAEVRPPAPGAMPYSNSWNVSAVASQIAPYLQIDRLGEHYLFEDQIASHMAQPDKNGQYAIAYESGSTRVLAFSFTRAVRTGRLNMGTPNATVFEQFGTTWPKEGDLRQEANKHPADPDIRWRGCAALAHYVTASLSASRLVLIPDYFNDSRHGYFFECAGFRPVLRRNGEPGPEWGSGDCVLYGTAGDIAGSVRAMYLDLLGGPGVADA